MTKKAWIIIAIAVFLSIASFWNDSVTVDEVPHIGAGYSYLTKGDYRLNPEHPPLVKDLTAIPLLFQKIDKEQLFSTKFWTKDTNGQWEFGRFLIFKASSDPQTTSRMAKFPILIFFVLSAVLIFHWTRKKYGSFAGYTALILFAFSPTVMAHARFVTTDMAAAFGVLISAFFFIKYLRSSQKLNFWLASIAFGVALLTKFSTFLLIPYLGALALIYGWIHDNIKFEQRIAASVFYGLRALLVFIVGFIVIVWPVYYLHTSNYPAERQRADTEAQLNTFGKRYLADPVVWASDKPIIRAAAHYGLGLLMVTQRQAGGNTTYFSGEVSKTAWKKYFPIVYFIKEPLAWWTLVIIVLTTIITKAKNLKLKAKNINVWVKNNFTECAMLLWLVVYWTLSVRGNLNIGVRHLLPVYPFTIMLVARQISRLLAKIKTKNGLLRRSSLGYEGREKLKITTKNLKLFTFYFLLFTLFGWYLFENVRIFPHYLSYFNQTAGGPSGGHKIVVDSNLDWGQNLKRFSDWTQRNNIQKIDFDYFGWADQEWYLKNRLHWITSRTYSSLEDFRQKNSTDGWIAVSATFLMGSRGQDNGNYEWLRQQKPLTTIGNSIFVYKLK